MLENIKKMKNIVHNFKDSDLVYKSTKNEAIFSCSTSSNEEMKSNLIFKNNINFNGKEEKHEDKKIFFMEKKDTNKESKKEFLINIQLYKDDYCIEWPNSLNNFNDIMSSTADLSLKEENNFEIKDDFFQKIPDRGEKEIDFCFKNKNNNINLYFNNPEDKKNNLGEDNEDCCSKMTNLYAQEYDNKKIINEILDQVLILVYVFKKID